MADVKGRFVWYELLTTDQAGAREFYSRVVGWTPKDAEMPGMQYWLFNIGDAMIAGMMDLPEQARSMGAPPFWMGYVVVDDVDESAATVTSTGGSIRMPPTDIPNIGRFAVIADPGGATLSLFKSANPEQDQTADQMAPGRVGWHELYAGSLDAAWPFYSGLFGWVKKDSMDMGPSGSYDMFGIGDVTLGGMMNKMPEMPMPVWGYYFNVGNINEAAERVKAGGGQVANGPMEVPGGGQWILQGVDPQGAHFALLGTT
jgi:predicted enzyme related to lactoylglutathione lyase